MTINKKDCEAMEKETTLFEIKITKEHSKVSTNIKQPKEQGIVLTMVSQELGNILGKTPELIPDVLRIILDSAGVKANFNEVSAKELVEMIKREVGENDD